MKKRFYLGKSLCRLGKEYDENQGNSKAESDSLPSSFLNRRLNNKSLCAPEPRGKVPPSLLFHPIAQKITSQLEEKQYNILICGSSTTSAHYSRIKEQYFLSYNHFPMHKNQTPNPHPEIFTTITPQVVSLIQNDSLCLQSLFFLNRINGPQIHLALSNLYLSVFTSKQSHPEFLFHTELSFDLKFQTLYELDGKCPPQQAVLSKPVGFRIFKEGKAKVQFYTKCKSLAELWIKQLARHLNQYGFARHYKLIKKVGKGGFASVFEVQRVTDKKHFAVKAFTKQSTLNSGDIGLRLNLLNEIQMLRTFDSPHLLKCEGIYESENSIYMVLELLSYGQLHTRINQNMAIFSLDQIREFIKGMAIGLKEMHDYRIMHRDIKPQNIMMRESKGLVPVIGDFGLSTDADLQDYVFYRCGTPGYVAPQVTTIVRGQHIEPECDIFSLGAIFHVLLTQKPLFEGKKCEEIYENNKKMKFSLNSALYKRVDSEAMDLLRRMLKIDPKERIKAAEILSHPFLRTESMEMDVEKCAETSICTESSAKDIKSQ